MKSKQHILILTPGFPENENDTTCIPPLQALVRELHSAYDGELKISVVAFQYPFKGGEYNWHGIKCWTAGGKNIKLPGKFFTWYRIINYISKLHKQFPVDVVHSFWLQDTTLLAQRVSKITGARHFAHAMGQDVLSSNSYIRFLSKNKLKVIANSPFTAETLKQEFDINAFTVIPFGINANDFTAPIDGLRTTDLLAVGSLTTVKNHKLFLEIFTVLKKTVPGLTGSIIGGGPLEETLREQIKQLGLEDCVRLEGLLSRSEVLKRMSESKILVHTASFESAGYVFLEALYCGMKVVAFPTGLLPEVSSAVTCNDKEAMVEKLKSLLSVEQEYKREKVPLISESAAALMKIYSAVHKN